MPPSTVPVSDAQFLQLIEQIGPLPSYTIGRNADNLIVIPNPKISGQHAQLVQCTLTSFLLEDLTSKNGTFVNGVRITRKVIGPQDVIRLADAEYSLAELLDQRRSEPVKPTPPLHAQSNRSGKETVKITVTPPPQPPALVPTPPANMNQAAKIRPDYSREFAELKPVFEQYPELRRACRSRDKMIRTGSVLVSTLVGVSAALATGGGTVLLQVLSGAGLSVLVPTLCSTFLSTDEKLEIIDKEYRERYRCPNPACRDPFGTREWEQLAQQKTCRRCEAIWVN